MFRLCAFECFGWRGHVSVFGNFRGEMVDVLGFSFLRRLIFGKGGFDIVGKDGKGLFFWYTRDDLMIGGFGK